jgi:recombinational DNA repair protein RecT
MNTAIATTGKVKDWLMGESAQQTITGALAGWMEPAQFNSQIIISLEDPKLSACSPRSKFEAAHLCAALALLPSFQQVALIPYTINGVKSVKVMPQWQGYKAIMERHPEVKEVSHDLVHPSDTFSFDGTTGLLDHHYDPLNAARHITKLVPEQVRGGYINITYVDGRAPKYHFVLLAEILKRKACAETKNVWEKWPREQAIKTLYRDCYARRIISVDPLVNQRLAAIADADDAYMGNDPSRVVVEQQLPARLLGTRTKMLEQTLTHEPQPPLPEVEKNPPKKTKSKAKSKKDTTGDDSGEQVDLQGFEAQMRSCKTDWDTGEVYGDAEKLLDKTALEVLSLIRAEVRDGFER